MKKKGIEGLRVNYAQAVHDEAEEKRVLAVIKEQRTIMGRETEEFEKRTAKYFGHKFGIMVNSGSSANLLAFEILNMPQGSEVITPLLTFSTTVAPLLKKGLIPVFADVQPGTYIIELEQIEKLITKKTKALMIPLLLGNVPDMERLAKIARKNKLFLIADCCDTFAPSYNGKSMGQYAHITTTSFYGSHIMTAGGGGGMIMLDNTTWKDQAKVFRGWGRSSSIFGDSESIEKRFSAKIGSMPYDAKFIFSEPGYNFLPTEIGAAFGNAQLDKIARFKKARQDNFKRLYKFFSKYNELFILPVQDKKVKTAWLAFPLTIKKEVKINRLELMTHLEKINIQTRPVFTGNILKQPGFKGIEHKTIKNYTYPHTNEVMEHSFLIGCHQGMEDKHMDKIEEVFTRYLERFL